MGKHIARTVLVLTVFFFRGTFCSAQTPQSKTETNCTTSPDYGAGRTTDCTSTTTTAPPPGGWLAGINKAIAANRAKAEANRDQKGQQTGQLSAGAIKELLAEEKQEREAKDTVDYIYCRQNPKGSITDSDGKAQSCGDVLAYTRAFCSVNPQAERCTLAKSKAEVDKAFAALLDQYNSDNHRNRAWEQSYYGERFAKLTKWGCMSFPDMVLPGPNGSSHACPDAPEPPPVQPNQK
jgi:sarcosine oxidase delta subunit